MCVCVCAITWELLFLADVTDIHANLSVTLMFVFEFILFLNMCEMCLMFMRLQTVQGIPRLAWRMLHCYSWYSLFVC